MIPRASGGIWEAGMCFPMQWRRLKDRSLWGVGMGTRKKGFQGWFGTYSERTFTNEPRCWTVGEKGAQGGCPFISLSSNNCRSPRTLGDMDTCVPWKDGSHRKLLETLLLSKSPLQCWTATESTVQSSFSCIKQRSV